MPSLSIIPSDYLFTSSDKKTHGLKGEYFNNHEFKGKPVFVLVLLNGSAVSVNWEEKNIPAIVESWYGG